VTTLLFLLAGALALVFVSLLALSLRPRSEARPERRLGPALSEMGARLDTLIVALRLDVEQRRGEAQSGPGSELLPASLELEDVAAETLRAARALPGADAAFVSVERFRREPLFATSGLTAQEAARHALPGLPNSRGAAVVSIQYRYGRRAAESTEPAIQAGVAVPLEGRQGAVGLLALLTRSPNGLDADAQAGLEELAGRAGPALENARLFLDAQELAELDPLTRLGTHRVFELTLAREVARAERHGRPLAVVAFALAGQDLEDEELAAAAERLQQAIRASDLPTRTGEDEFAVILPEATLTGCRRVVARVQRAIGTRPAAGAAELRPVDDARLLARRTKMALERAKQVGAGEVVLASNEPEEA